jgi:hypothetical protein
MLESETILLRWFISDGDAEVFVEYCSKASSFGLWRLLADS